MKRNQKHSKENIFPVIEAWQEGGQSQAKFCKENKLSISTFQYWLKKYRETRSETQSQTKLEEQRKSESFSIIKGG
jgi:transposase